MSSYNAAQEICKTFFKGGYIAYFAGGWVRDYLMGNPSDEIDIATNAPPSVIQKLFNKTIPIGLAFGVILVVVENYTFEVTTFRKDLLYSDGRHPEGVVFSTPEKDALRRDFTINGMFYDPLNGTFYDYVGGEADLRNKIIRAIGKPEERFIEDRLRMIRAVRFAARFSFQIEKETADAIQAHASSLFPAVSMERVWQEFEKMAFYPHFDQAILQLYELGLLTVIFPTLSFSSYDDIQKWVAPFSHFPKDSPTMAYLLELFPEASYEEKIALCLYLKTSAKEKKMVEFFHQLRPSLMKEIEDKSVLAHFYAHPLSQLLLGIEAAKRKGKAKLHFIEKHYQQEQQLMPHIRRIQNKTPLVTASHLIAKGIPPGKQLGMLLIQAERIAIQENLSHPQEVLEKLDLFHL